MSRIILLAIEVYRSEDRSEIDVCLNYPRFKGEQHADPREMRVAAVALLNWAQDIEDGKEFPQEHRD